MIERDKNSEMLRAVLSELYNEVRDRRAITQKILNYYGGFCALVMGWSFTLDTPMKPAQVFLIIAFVIGFGVTSLVHLEAHSRSYSTTARTIVNISEKLGLYEENVYPNEWKRWGKNTHRWDHGVIIIMSIATSILLYINHA